MANFTPAQIEQYLAGFSNAQQKRGLEHLFQEQDTTDFGVADTPLTRAYPTGPVFGVANTAKGVTAVEFCADGYHHTTVLHFDGAASKLPTIAGGANLGVGLLLYTLPVGAEVINSSFMSVAITQTQGHINTNTPDTGLGTVIASGAIAVLDGNGAFENISTGVATDDCNGDPLEVAALPTTSSLPFVIQQADAHTIYLNVAFNWSASGDAGALLTGTVTINWDLLSAAAAQ
jgi:hypothetical protein